MNDSSYHRSTQIVRPGEQFAYWRDAICDAYVPLEPERAEAPGFKGRIDGLMLPELRSSTITAEAHEVRLSSSGLARQQSAPFFVNLMRAGEVVVRQDGRALRAGPGDIYVVDCASTWEVDFRSSFSMFCIEIDDALLRPRLGRRGRLVSPVLTGDGGTGRILANYMRLVHELPSQDLLQVQSLMVGHCSDLLSRAQVSEKPDTRADRLRCEMRDRILALMRNRLSDRSLTPDAACAELGISRSYLFKILGEFGHTFSGYLRQCRLDECHRVLKEQPKRPIADIAADWGFDEVSTFNRAYRARFGQTPSQARGCI
jgi:AraC family transcriptional activator of tynA and feaB